jgi:hypothetical protein
MGDIEDCAYCDIEEFGNTTTDGKELVEPKRRGEAGIEEKPTEEQESDKLKKNQWSIVGSGRYLASSLTVKTLPSGVYTFQNSNLGIIFRTNLIQTDNLINFPDSLFSSIINEVDRFWDIGDNFKKYGFLHRRGYLFYGPAGGGKSCLIQRICQNVVSKGGIVFITGNIQPKLSFEGLRAFREVEPDRKIVCIFEDIDSLIREWGDAELLMLLDGENQVDKVINIASTNYPELLDKRIVARPRRFDRIVKIGMPNTEIREVYFQNKLGMNGKDEDLNKWVRYSEGFSFAALSELVISVKCLGNSFDDSVKRLKDLNVKKSSSEFEESKVGFTN